MAVMLGSATAIIDLDISGFASNAERAKGLMNDLGASGGKGMDSFSQKVQKAAGSIDMIGKGMVGFGLAIVGSTGFGIKAAAQFEQGMANIGAATGATGDELESLRQLALQLGKDTNFSANEATDAIMELGLAGISTTDIIGGAADAVVMLAQASGEDLVSSTTVVTNAMNQFGIAGEDSMRIVDALANGAMSSSAEVSTLGEGLTYVGTQANALGIPLEDTIAALAALNDQSIKGSMAGTSLNQALSSIVNPTAKASEALSELGLSSDWMINGDGSFKSLTDIIGTLDTATKGLTDTEKQRYLNQIFGEQGGRAINALLQTQSEEAKKAGKSWQDYLNAMDKSGTASEMAAKRMNTFKGDLEQFRGTLETIGIVVGSYFLPFMRAATQGLTAVLDMFLNLPPGIQQAIAMFTGLAGVLSLVGGAFLLMLPRIVAIKEALATLKTVGLFSGLAGGIPILLGVAAAAGLAYAAYRTNFLGIGDIMDNVGGKAKTFWDALTGDTPKVDNLTASQRAYVDQLREQGVSEARIADYLEKSGVAAEYTQKKYDNLTAEQRKYVDMLREQGVSEARIADYLEKSGVAAEYTTSEYQHLRQSMNPLSAGSVMLGRAFKAIGWDTLGNGIIGAGKKLDTFLDTFNGLRKTMGPLQAGLGALITTFPSLSGPISKVTGLVSRLQSNFARARKYGLDPFEAGFQSLYDSVPKLRPVLDMLTPVVIALDTAFERLEEAFAAAGNKAADTLSDYQKYRDQGLNPLVAAGRALYDNFSAVRTVFDALGPSAAPFLYAIKNLFTGDFSGAVANFREAWSNIGETISNVADLAGTIGSALGGLAVDLGGWVLNVGAPAVTGWIADHAGDVWGAISSAAGWAWSGLVDIGTWTLDVATPALTGWLSDHAGDIWNALKTAAGWAGDVAGTIVDWTLNVGAPTVGGWIKVAAGNAWDAIRALAGGLSTMAGSIVAWTLDVGAPTLGGWITSAANSSVVAMILTLIGSVVVKLGTWTLVVGAPTVVLEGWDVVGAITRTFRTQVLVPLNAWTLGLSGPEIIYQGLSLTQAVGDWVNRNILSINMNTWKLILGVPLFVLSGPIGWSAALGAWVLSQMPKSVVYEAALTIQVAGQILFSGLLLGAKILQWVAQQVGVLGVIGVTISVTLAAIDLITTGVSLIAKAALWVADQLGAGVNATMRITVGAVEWVGDTAKSLFGAGLGLVGSITAKFPDFKWPDLPTFSWPNFPTFSWPEIPRPSWLPSFLGGGDDKKNNNNEVLGPKPETPKPTAPQAPPPALPPQGFGGAKSPFDATGMQNAIDLLTSLGNVATATESRFSSFASSISTLSSTSGAALTALASGFIATGTLISSAVTTWGTSLTTFTASVATMGSTAGASLTALTTGFIVTGSMIGSAITTWGTSLTTFSATVAAASSTTGAQLTALASGFIATGSLIGAAMATMQAAASTSLSSIDSAANATAGALSSFAGVATGAMGSVGAGAAAMAGAIVSAAGAGIGAAQSLTGAINAIPTQHTTVISLVGASEAIGAANGVAAAVANIPSSKTISVNIATTGSVPAMAQGGVMEGSIARMAELGPEALRFPSGKMGMAMTDSLYAVPPGTYVYTAAETKRMFPSFASGGTVGGWSSIGSAIGNIRGLDSKQFQDMVKALKELTEGTRRNNRALISTLTNYQDQLAKYTQDDRHPAGALTASRQLGAAIKAFTTGGTFRLNGMTESYGLADRYYGAKSGASGPRTPNRTPNSGGNRPQQLTTLVTHYHITSLKSDELVQVLDGAEKGSHVYKELSKLPQRRQTSNLRTVGSS